MHYQLLIIATYPRVLDQHPEAETFAVFNGSTDAEAVEKANAYKKKVKKHHNINSLPKERIEFSMIKVQLNPEEVKY